jgi:hypothetical protein
MRRVWIVLALAVSLTEASGCHKTMSDQDLIRAGIRQHLTANRTLNLAVMDYDIRNVTINGDRAQADVEFRLKQGGATMQVTYALARTDDVWRVLKSQPVGGQIEHPPMTDVHAGVPSAAPKQGVPTINDFFAIPAPSGAQAAIPPGRPATTSLSSVPAEKYLPAPAKKP